MIRADRTVKILLAAIAVLLALNLLRPLPGGTPAQAQTRTQGQVSPRDDGKLYLPPELQLISRVTYPSEGDAPNVIAMDQSRLILLEYEDRLEVYHVFNLFKQ